MKFTCDDRFETHLHHLLAAFEDKKKAIEGSLEYWLDPETEKERNNKDIYYNKEHYITHFKGMKMCIDDVIRSVKCHIRIFEEDNK